jgi:outer membrane protein OmpA-like peptidoglycan-associated protein
MNNYSFGAVQGLCFAILIPFLGYSQTDVKAEAHINVSRAINTSIIPEALSDKVNSNYVEAGPKLSLDGKRLYYSRYGHPANTGGEKDQDIWYNDFIDSTQSWSDAVNIGPPLNNKGPNFVFEVGWNGDSLLLGNIYGKNGKMTSGLSVSLKTGNTWSMPRAVKLKNDYNLSPKGTFDLSHDREALLISEERDNSYGKRDLYVTLRQPGKDPYAKAEAINLGPIINTAGEEASPFLADDDKTLFFSSDGHNGYGMSDLFMSKRLDDTWVNWSKPENLGPQINTPFDDGQLVFSPHDRYAYYSRGITATRTDIYRVETTYLFIPVNDISDRTIDEIGQTHVINDVFEDNKAAIDDEAMPEFDEVIDYMQRYPTLTVMISTHSNRHKSRKESHALSNQRAIAIEDYLTKKGIDKGRLRFQSYGQDILSNARNPELEKQIPAQVEFSFLNYGR